jgi:6-phosphogluconolactonase
MSQPERHELGSAPAGEPEILVLPSAEALAAAAARTVGECAAAAIVERGAFRLGVCGGTSLLRLYRVLARDDWPWPVDWAHTTLLFADERAVPPDHADSNYRLVRETLLEPVGMPEANVRRMRGEDPDLERAAREYEGCLEEPVDLLLLGIGADGHVASLFPGGPAVTETVRRVVPVTDSPKPPPRRLTLTPRAIREARIVIVLATGAEKAAAVARALDPRTPDHEIPAHLVRDRVWLLDLSAAALVGGPN